MINFDHDYTYLEYKGQNIGNFVKVIVFITCMPTHIVYTERTLILKLCQVKSNAHKFLYLQQQLALEYSAAGHHPVFVLQ